MTCESHGYPVTVIQLQKVQIGHLRDRAPIMWQIGARRTNHDRDCYRYDYAHNTINWKRNSRTTYDDGITLFSLYYFKEQRLRWDEDEIWHTLKSQILIPAIPRRLQQLLQDRGLYYSYQEHLKFKYIHQFKSLYTVRIGLYRCDKYLYFFVA